MEKPSEILLFDFLAEAIRRAEPGTVLYELELHDTVYQKIATSRGIRISDAFGSMAPDIGGGIKEYDVNLQIVCFSKVEGKEKSHRQPALADIFEIQKAVYLTLLGDQTLGGRVCDSWPGKGLRAYDSMDGTPYAVANISLVINPSGEQ